MIRAAVLQNAEYVRKDKNSKKRNIRLLTEEKETRPKQRGHKM
jgi:hypothetical protein